MIPTKMVSSKMKIINRVLIMLLIILIELEYLEDNSKKEKDKIIVVPGG